MHQNERGFYAKSPMKTVTSRTTEKQLDTDSSKKFTHSTNEDISPVKPQNESESPVNCTTNISTQKSRKESIPQREQYVFESTVSDTRTMTRKQPESDKVKTEPSTSIREVVFEESLTTSEIGGECKINTESKFSDENLMLETHTRPFEQISLSSVTLLTPEKPPFTGSQEEILPLQSEDISPVQPQQNSESQKNYDTNVQKVLSKRNP
ncbi:hypothetical protein WA026_020665 [Henosepilachna vigintioctopunctata]|uniref:Uncharacterized protein n=1 Tax=Henosepilachna vigintioctopunctata TaxID=420089 RepID=A0AAW1U2X4_9CUCU